MAASSLIWAIVALFFPPLPVAIRKGCSGHLVVNIILLILAWIPAVLHAWYVILEYDNDGQKKANKRISTVKNESAITSNEKVPIGNQQGAYGPGNEKVAMSGPAGYQQGAYGTGNQHATHAQLAPQQRQGTYVEPSPQVLGAQGHRQTGYFAEEIQSQPQQQPPTYPQQQQQVPEYARDVKN